MEITALLLFLLTGCSFKKTEEIDLLDETKIKTYEYEDSNTINSNFIIDTFDIDIPIESRVGSFCIIDDTIYYSLDFTQIFENPTGEEAEPVFEDKHNTQIRSYDKKNNNDELVYQYKEDKCIEVTDIQSNGKYLVWEDYLNSSMYNVNCLNLINNEKEKILSREKGKENLSTITLKITDDDLYWYELSEGKTSDYNNFVLYSYDFKTKNTDIKEEGLYLSSPFEHVSIIEDIITTYKKDDDKDITTISIYDNGKKKERQLKVSGDISDPISNGEICVWMDGYGYADGEYMFIYDLSEDSLEKIHLSYAFTYGLIGDFVLLNKDNESLIYDIKNKTYESLDQANYTSNGYIYHGLLGNLYAEKFENIKKLEVINYKIK